MSVHGSTIGISSLSFKPFSNLLLHEGLGQDALRGNGLFDAAELLDGVVSLFAVVWQQADYHLSRFVAVRLQTRDESLRSGWEKQKH